MAKAPTRSNARIEPKIACVPPDLVSSFTFFVDDMPTREVKWSLSDPDIGKMGGPFGEDFQSAPEPRISHAVLTGKSLDGKYTATADIYTEIGREIGDRFVPVDNWSVAFTTPIPWNDPKGRRAWLLMMDIIHQLPKVFLDNIPSQICLVRASEIFSNPRIRGMHWPFDRKAVIISESAISKLTQSPSITPEDVRFARTFLHELSHVVLANRAFKDGDRALRAILGGLSWALLPFSGLLLGHVPLLPNRDFLSDYADVTGWVTNGLQWVLPLVTMVTKQSPDVITGLALVGYNPMVNLRNEPFNDALGKGSNDPVGDAGMPSYPENPTYAAHDVHEDWAVSFTYLAFTKNWAALTGFRKRAEFFIKNKCWPAGYTIKPGGWLQKWQKDHPLKPSDPAKEAARSPMDKWAVHFGSYAGAPPKKAVSPSAPNTPTHGKRPTKKARALKIKSIPEPEPSGGDEPFVRPASGDTEDFLGSGGSEKSPWNDEIKEQFELMPQWEKVAEMMETGVKEALPTLQKQGKAWSELPYPPEDGSLIELLRAAEMHGDGVSYCPPPAKGARVPPLSDAKEGEIIVLESGSVWCVVEADKGRPVRMAAVALPQPSEDRPNPKQEDLWSEAKIRYRLRAVRKARRWFVPLNSVCPYEKLDDSMRHFVKLWGKNTSPAERDLSRSAALLAEVLEQANLTMPETKRKTWWEDVSIDGLQAICDAHGEGTKPVKPAAVQVGDVVCLKNPDRLGVVIGMDGDGDNGLPQNLLVNGDEDEPGVYGEPEGAAKLMHRVAPSRLVWFWRPAN